MRRISGGIIACAIALAAAAGTAAAQSADAQKPWAQGVSAEDQARAEQLFREGNALLQDSLFLKAAEKYREAVSHWDHPAIHYNLALALLNLDQPIEVFHALESATKWGAAAIGQDKFERARDYKLLIAKQIATVEVVCKVEGAKVSLDGKQLFVGPGKWSGMVRAGEHALVANAPGYVPVNRTQRFEGAEPIRVELTMYTADELTRYRRRWAPWKPWAVVGGGVAVAAAGALLHVSARADFAEYDDAVAACGGCVPTPEMNDLESSAKSKQGFAIAMYGVGAATLVGGGVLLYLNRQQPYRITEQQLLEEQRGGAVSVAPILAPDFAGAAATVRF